METCRPDSVALSYRSAKVGPKMSCESGMWSELPCTRRIEASEDCRSDNRVRVQVLYCHQVICIYKNCISNANNRYGGYLPQLPAKSGELSANPACIATGTMSVLWLALACWPLYRLQLPTPAPEEDLRKRKVYVGRSGLWEALDKSMANSRLRLNTKSRQTCSHNISPVQQCSVPERRHANTMQGQLVGMQTRPVSSSALILVSAHSKPLFGGPGMSLVYRRPPVNHASQHG